MSNEIILPFSNVSAQSLQVSGGKGANLAKLSQALPVPSGFIVTSLAYETFLQPIRSDIFKILQETANVHDQAQYIQKLISNEKLPEQVEEALCKQLDAMQAHKWSVAVRSSATLEDLPGAAFAGQHDTYLNCQGFSDIAQAICKCYASLWHEHAMHYRNHRNLSHWDAAMAVVVQKMVNVSANDAAGVAFSIDPIQGNLSQVLINSAFGLGESVVDGEHAVDEFRIQVASQQITERAVATKPTALVASLDGQGSQRVALALAQAESSSLTDQQCLQVAALAKQAESFFGFPQDIEWAFSQNQLYLLQSRPVTSMPERWTRDESAERFPNVVTPLTWDLVEEGFHTSLNYSFKLMGLPHFGGKWFGMKDCYIYGNQNVVELYSNRIPLKIETFEDVQKAIPLLAEKYTWVQDLPTFWMRDLDTYLLAIGSLMQEQVELYSIEEQWDYIKRIRQIGTQYFLPNIAISLTQRILYTALYRLVQMTVDASEVQSLYDQLLGACHTKTVEVNKELWQLSREVRHNTSLMALFEEKRAVELLSEIKAFPDFEQRVQLFLQRHGHRELDFDAYYPTWLEAPYTVIDELKALSKLDDSTHKEREWESVIAATSARQRLVSLVPEELRYLVDEVIRLARVYTQLDDLEHYQTTRITLPFRKGLKALGDRLVKQGVFENQDDIYFVPFDALDKAIANSDYAQLAEISARNKFAWKEAQKKAPAWVYGEQEDVQWRADTDVLKGLSGSPGQVEGEVFIVHSPEEFSQFPEGAILVARTTNPAWTSLFYRAKGIITESGGPLSHGAVTARELNIPAVMSVRHAMSYLQNGMRVQVDGKKGLVHCL